MKRDMDLVRKILLSIEEQYEDVALYDFKIDGYDMKTVAYHCNILYTGGFIEDFAGNYSDNEICDFAISGLTWEGHEFLDIIRNDEVWNKTKDTIKQKKLPYALDIFRDIAKAIVSAATQAAIKSLINPTP